MICFLIYNLYKGYLKIWNTSFDAWHLLINHRYYIDAENFKLYPEFDEDNVWKHNVTFCMMARDILTRIKDGH